MGDLDSPAPYSPGRTGLRLGIQDILVFLIAGCWGTGVQVAHDYQRFPPFAEENNIAIHLARGEGFGSPMDPSAHPAYELEPSDLSLSHGRHLPDMGNPHASRDHRTHASQRRLFCRGGGGNTCFGSRLFFSHGRLGRRGIAYHSSDIFILYLTILG